MTLRTMNLAVVTVKQSRVDGDYVTDNVEGTDLLDLFHHLATTASPSQLSRREQFWWCNHSRSTRLDRAVLSEFQSGSFGDARDVVDTTTGLPSYSGSDDDSHLIRSRVLCVVPPGQKFALLASEREGTEGAGQRVRTLLQRSIVGIGPVTDAKGKPRELVANISSVTRGEAWLATAEVTKVEAIRQAAPLEVRDGTFSSVAVRRRESFEPVEGVHRIAGMFQRLRGKSVVEAADYLCFDDADEVDEIVLTASDGGHEKKFPLVKEKSPAMRLLIKDHGEKSPTDQKFIEHAESLMGPYMNDIHGVPWQSSWVR